MTLILSDSVTSVNNALILGFIPGTEELLNAHAEKLMYTSFERMKPEDVQFLVTGVDQLVIGCLIVSEKTGKQLLPLADGLVDLEELEDWVNLEATYTHISSLEIWEQYQGKGFGTIAVERIKATAKHPISLYSVGESMSFWDQHAENMSGYWYCEQK